MFAIPWLTLTLLTAGAASEPESIAVIPLVAKRIPRDAVAALDDLLLASIGQTGKYRGLGPSDINAMIGMEKMREVLGCDDVSCAVELGGALGVDLLVTGSVSKLGGSVIVTLSLIDAKAHVVVRRSKANVKNDEDLYAQAIDRAVCELLEESRICASRFGEGGSGGTGATASLQPGAATPAPAAPTSSTGRGYERYENGRLVKNDAGMRWGDGIADCVEARKKADKPVTLSCTFDGKRMGYELLWDGVLVGYEPGWDLPKARANCAWNIGNHRDKRVECRFEGQALDLSAAPPVEGPPPGATGRGYELFFLGRLVKQATTSRADAIADCIGVRDRFGPHLTPTCDVDGKRLGYELFWDGARAGYEPGWSLEQARANCAWNMDAHKETRVECRFEGKSITP